MIVSLLAYSFMLLVLSRSLTKQIDPTYGVPPLQQSLYQKQFFNCLDSSSHIPISFVNDNYCDCQDGSDEPGTSACDFQFYCNNNGLVGSTIKSSRVNDQICDCCDGSDEYLYLSCENICQKEFVSISQQYDRHYIDLEVGLKLKYEYVQEMVRQIQKENIKNNKKIEKIVALFELFGISCKNYYQDQMYQEFCQKLSHLQKESSQIVVTDSKNQLWQLFHNLKDQCLTLLDARNQYEYEICFFNNAYQTIRQQKNKKVKLGSFKNFQSSNIINFENGDFCSRNLYRSMTVKFQCGQVNKIMEIKEYEICKYSVVVSTFSVCKADNLSTFLPKVEI